MDYLKVLVVHRQEVMLNEVKSIMEKFGPYLKRCTCGIDGLQAAKLQSFDLILCGTDLPLITGFEMIRSIRNLSKNCLTPVVFITNRIVERHPSLCRQLSGLGIIGERNLRANLLLILETRMTGLEPDSAEQRIQTAFN